MAQVDSGSENQDVEKLGLIGLAYSLISQLLQFEFEEDSFNVPREELDRLDGSRNSWEHAMALFSVLLKKTPHLSLCVIDGLNDMAFSSGAEWCSEFLKILFSHQKSCLGVFRILLTTTGQSRVLQDYVSVSDRVLAQGNAREAFHGGQWATTRDRQQ